MYRRWWHSLTNDSPSHSEWVVRLLIMVVGEDVQYFHWSETPRLVITNVDIHWIWWFHRFSIFETVQRSSIFQTVQWGCKESKKVSDHRATCLRMFSGVESELLVRCAFTMFVIVAWLVSGVHSIGQFAFFSVETERGTSELRSLEWVVSETSQSCSCVSLRWGSTGIGSYT
jgi:hypothetical protein